MQETAEHARAQSKSAGSDSAPRRIMLVDDDPFVRDVVVTALAAIPGMRVGAYGSGAAALAAMDGFAPDLVVLDLMMPEMDGRATWAAIIKRGGAVPRLIVLTGRDDDAARDEIAGLGAAGLIVKPFDPSTVAATILGLADAAAVRTARMESLAQAFAASLPATLKVMDTVWTEIASAWRAESAEALLIEAHKIAGVAPMFRFRRLGEAADKVEEMLRAAVMRGGWRDEAERGEVEGAVGMLLVEGRAACGIRPRPFAGEP